MSVMKKSLSHRVSPIPDRAANHICPVASSLAVVSIYLSGFDLEVSTIQVIFQLIHHCPLQGNTPQLVGGIVLLSGGRTSAHRNSSVGSRLQVSIVLHFS